MEKKEYNGWTNFETYQCSLWLESDENLIAASQSITDIESLRELISDHLYEDMHDAAGLATDIVNAWMDEVNYAEIWNSRYEKLLLEATAGETA